MSVSGWRELMFDQGFHFTLPSFQTARNQGEIGMKLRRKFTGKELDEETGYGYFGARYMDHELMTGWTAVDPMADKYPGMSPYNYCAWNPVKLVDPDGREIWHPIIDLDGTINYIPDQSDTKESFKKQYGLSNQQTDAIFKESNVTSVSKGTIIKGNAVREVTGSNVLKLDWNESSDKQKAYQAMFGILHSSLKKK